MMFDGKWELILVAELSPTPDFAVQMIEEVRALMERLQDETLTKAAIMKMKGYPTRNLPQHLDYRSERSYASYPIAATREWDLASRVCCLRGGALRTTTRRF
jgi:hypothetical protein